MTNKLSSTNESRRETLDRTTQPAPSFWIPFGIAGIGLIAIGLFRFAEKTDNIYFIYISLIAFAIAAFPWISSIRVKGILEIDRAIDHVREEARDRVEQASKRFDDRLLILRTELITQLSSVQTQVAQQTSQQESRQIVQVNAGLQGVEASEIFQKQVLKPTEIEDLKVKLPPSSELPSKYSELRSGFANATSTALNDPFGLRCGKLLSQIPEMGLSSKEFEETRLNYNVTDEQIRIMKTLGLITVEAGAGKPDEENISVSELGRIYTDYWNERFQKIKEKIKEIGDIKISHNVLEIIRKSLPLIFKLNFL